MQLSKHLSGPATYRSLSGKEDLRFELFDWLKDKGLTAKQAMDLLSLTRDEIMEARRAALDTITL